MEALKASQRAAIKKRLWENARVVLGVLFLGEILTGAYSLIHDNLAKISAWISAAGLWLFEYAFLIAIGVLLVLLFRYLWRLWRRIKNADRLDLVISLILSVILLIYFNNLAEFSDRAALTVFIISIILAIIAIGYLIKKKMPGADPDAFFISDVPETDPEEDFLDFKEDAENFAERVLNGFSRESLVFGLDAPWGSGKSTYLNFCKKYWAGEKYKSKLAIFEFQSLSFVGENDIFEKFVGEFLRTINSAYFIPDFGRALSRYAKILKNFNIGFHGVELSLDSGTPAEDALQELKDTLADLDKKIIVIIDDLDRLTLNDIKTMLDVVKKSFVLPNVTYVICYETKNIDVFGSELKKTNAQFSITGSNAGAKQKFEGRSVATESPNQAKITEYFEKVVNVKKTLIVPREGIKNYLITTIKSLSLKQDNGDDFRLLSENSLSDAIAAIEEIFNPNEFEKYICYIGDLRKVKRLLNILKMQINDINVDEIDISIYDLLHLLLIYINFPNIFRLIYTSETDGARGFFSLTHSYQPDDANVKWKYVNSEKYKEYVTLLDPTERFLLDKIFSEERFAQKELDAITSKVKSNAAAFNGGDFGQPENLKDYLKLIVKNEKPDVSDAYNFHFANIKKFIAGTDMSVILSDPRYQPKNGERSRLLFFKILLANMDKIDYGMAQRLIDYFLDAVKSFASVENGDLGTGLRTNIDLYLVKILNDRGWKDKNGGQDENTKENIKTIADRIFGEGDFSKKGIVQTLSEADRGVMGIYDLLAFRLYCCQDRGGDFFNLYRALSYRANPDAKDSGLVQELLIEEMRELSQRCFQTFKTRYITPKANIFSEAYQLDDAALFGSSLEHARKMAKEKNLDLAQEVQKMKTRILPFTLYQLGNDVIELGVGCGFYDETGKGKGGIKKALSKYLFDFCFNVDDSTDMANAKYFVDFLLMNLGSGFGGRRGFEYQPIMENYLKILDKAMLTEYWKQSGEKIIVHFKEHPIKEMLYTSNYAANYGDDLVKVFSILNKLVEPVKKESAEKF